MPAKEAVVEKSSDPGEQIRLAKEFRERQRETERKRKLERERKVKLER